MSAGPDRTRRQQLPSTCASRPAQNDLIIKLEPNAGTEDCLNLLKIGQLDAAVVSSGVKVPDDDEIMVLVPCSWRPSTCSSARTSPTQAHSANHAREADQYWRSGQYGMVVGPGVPQFARLQLPSASSTGDVVLTEHSKADLVGKARTILRPKGRAETLWLQNCPIA